jgi:hypothetical protein
MPDPRIVRGPARLKIHNASNDKRIVEVQLDVKLKNGTQVTHPEAIFVPPQHLEEVHVDPNEPLDDIGFMVRWLDTADQAWCTTTMCENVHADLGIIDTVLTLDDGGGLHQLTRVIPDALPPHTFVDYSPNGEPCGGAGG